MLQWIAKPTDKIAHGGWVDLLIRKENREMIRKSLADDGHLWIRHRPAQINPADFGPHGAGHLFDLDAIVFLDRFNFSLRHA